MRTDAVRGSNKAAILTVSVKGLRSMKSCLCGMADNPFMIIKRLHAIDQAAYMDSVKVHETEFKTETTNPLWYIKDLRIQSLCNSDPLLPIEFEIWNYNDDGNHKMYGSFQT